MAFALYLNVVSEVILRILPDITKNISQSDS